MAAYQYIYTSWREFGYQVYAKSPQIPETEFPLIFKHIKYTAPAGLPDTSDIAEIDKHYPLAFSSFTVNGKPCIARTRYLGQDDSGRYGNYFCHMLMFPQTPAFYPTDLFGSPLWKECLTAEEKQADRGPQELEPLFDTPRSTTLNRDALMHFIDRVGEDAAISMISSLLYAKAMKQRMVIWDTQDKLPLWFALLVNAFPVGTDISFTTYTSDFLQSSLDVISVPPQGCSFSYSMEQANRRMVVMDMHNGICTRDIPVSKYAEFIVTSLQYAPDNLDRLFSFLKGLNSPIEWKQYDLLCRVYLYINGGLPLSGSALTVLLREAEALSKTTLNEQLAAHVMDALDEEYDPQPDADVLRFLLQYEQERQAQVFGYVHEHLIRTLHNDDAEIPAQMEKQWMSNPWPCQGQLIQYLADDYCIGEVADLLTEDQVNAACLVNASVYILLITHLCGQPEARQNAMAPVQRMLAEVTEAPEDVGRRIAPLEKDAMLYTCMLTLLYDCPCASNQWMIQTMLSSASKEPNWWVQVERCLAQNPRTALLSLQLLYVSCPQAKDRRARFWALYQRSCAESAAASQLLADYLLHVDQDQAFAEAMDVLMHIPPSQLPPDILGLITPMLSEGALETVLKKYSGAAMELLQALQYHGQPVPAGVLNTFGVLMRLQSALSGGCKPSDVLPQAGTILGSLNKQDYASFLETIMPQLVPQMRDDADLTALMRDMTHSKYGGMLADSYTDQLRTLSRNVAVYSAALMCPLISAAVRPAGPEILALEKDLVGVFSKMHEDSFHQLTSMATSISGVPVSTCALVKRIDQKRENSLGNKLKNLFSKK